MQHTQPTEASRYLIDLARKLAEVYTTLPEIRAILLTGSASEGVSDFYSDLDLILYYDQLPSEEAFAQAAQHNGGENGSPLAPRSEGQFVEHYVVNGVECQFGHTTVAEWEQEIAAVLDERQVDTPIQKALGGIEEAIPLYGEALVQQWQARLADYPEALAVAMAQHYLDTYPHWGLQERLKTRDATIWYTEMLVRSAYAVLGALAGLNHLYFTTFQFKRMRTFIEKMTIAPPNCADRLEGLFHVDAEAGAAQSRALMEETLALVVEHLPQVDTTKARARLDYQPKAWSPGS